VQETALGGHLVPQLSGAELADAPLDRHRIYFGVDREREGDIQECEHKGAVRQLVKLKAILFHDGGDPCEGFRGLLHLDPEEADHAVGLDRVSDAFGQVGLGHHRSVGGRGP